MELNLKGKTAIISGGNKGLGAASAKALAAEGANVFLTARNADDLQATGDEITAAHGVEVRQLAIDITDEGAGEKIVEAALAQFDRIDILVNAAGAARGGVFHDIEDQVWRARKKPRNAPERRQSEQKLLNAPEKQQNVPKLPNAPEKPQNVQKLLNAPEKPQNALRKQLKRPKNPLNPNLKHRLVRAN